MMKVAVIRFPGSNCDRDAYMALKGRVKDDPIMVWHQEVSLPKVDLIILPGGFSYGDYLRSGAIAARSPIMTEVIKAANDGRYLLGICNGFQILTETRLLPGTLMHNRDLKFIGKKTYIKVTGSSIFSDGYQQNQVLQMPIAHGEGNYFASKDDIKRLTENDQIIFRYSDVEGNITEEANPNGSMDNIAGIVNLKKNVMGMMPHPERVVDAVQGKTDGNILFDYLAKKLS